MNLENKRAWEMQQEPVETLKRAAPESAEIRKSVPKG